MGVSLWLEQVGKKLTLEPGFHQIQRVQAERGDDACSESRYGLHKG